MDGSLVVIEEIGLNGRFGRFQETTRDALTQVLQEGAQKLIAVVTHHFTEEEVVGQAEREKRTRPRSGLFEPTSNDFS